MGNIQLYFSEIIRDERTGWISYLLKAILYVLSWPYWLIMSARNWLYDYGWLKQYQAPIPVVVSVGNIVAGGTGKTPFTLMLAKEFTQNVSVAILTRGYRSPAEKQGGVITLSKGNGPLHSAAYCGDEPVLLSKNLEKAAVYVGKNRIESAILAARGGAQLAILDDGMQHRQLGRDYEIVLIDSSDPFGYQQLLPRGFLREDLSALKRADLIVVNYVEGSDSFNEISAVIRRYTTVSIVGTKIKDPQIFDYQGTLIESIAGKRVVLFSGISKPKRFIHTVEGLGADVVESYHFPDHFSYKQEQISQIAEKAVAVGAEFIVCTEKDYVKLLEIHELPIALIWVKMELKVEENISEWDKFLGKIRSGLVRRES